MKLKNVWKPGWQEHIEDLETKIDYGLITTNYLLDIIVTLKNDLSVRNQRIKWYIQRIQKMIKRGTNRDAKISELQKAIKANKNGEWINIRTFTERPEPDEKVDVLGYDEGVKSWYRLEDVCYKHDNKKWTCEPSFPNFTVCFFSRINLPEHEEINND